LDKSIAAPIDFVLTPEAKYNKSALLIKNASDEVVFERSVPFTPDQVGFTFAFKVWARNLGPDGHDIEFKLGFDFGGGLVESAAIPITDPNDTVQFPQLMEFSQVLPLDATKFKVSIKRTTGGSGPEEAIIEKAAVFQEPFDSLFLGDGTVPRSGGRSAFGSLIYVWSADELSGSEAAVIGIDAPSTSGLIREVHNSHEQIDAFDVTDVVLGDIVNVRGVVDEAEWIGASLTNLEIISRSPTRFSHVKPALPTRVEGEEVSFTQISPFVANLFFFSDEDQDNSVLYENGIPLANDQWLFKFLQVLYLEPHIPLTTIALLGLKRHQLIWIPLQIMVMRPGLQTMWSGTDILVMSRLFVKQHQSSSTQHSRQYCLADQMLLN
jgi:hypothetical protein